MEKRDQHEVSLVAAIISDNYCKELYEAINTGYISTIDKIVDLAEAFYDQYKDENWEEHLESENECWDDCVIRWAGEKLTEEFGNRFKLQNQTNHEI